MKTLFRTTAATLLASTLLAGAAHAAAFGPATGAIAVLGSPTVTLGAGSGTAAFDDAAAIFSTTGSLTAASGSGFADGTIDFSDLDGAVVPEAINSFLTFNDKTGGEFVFDIGSAQTINYVNNPGTNTSIGLYLLGTASDANLGLSPVPTSVTLTINSTADSAYSASATIAAPPSMTSAAPEPATWALMFAGVAMIGGALRFSRTRARAVVAA